MVRPTDFQPDLANLRRHMLTDRRRLFTRRLVLFAYPMDVSLLAFSPFCLSPST